MPSSLSAQLTTLASRFAEQVLDAIKSASLQELVGAKGSAANGRPAQARPTATLPEKARVKPSGRLARRSPEEIAKAVDKIVLLVKTHKEGMRAEEIRSRLGLLPKEMPRILKAGVAAKKLSSKGQKRATTYFAK